MANLFKHATRYCLNYAGTAGKTITQSSRICTTTAAGNVIDQLPNITPDPDGQQPPDNITAKYEKVLKHPDYFEVAKLFTVEDLFKCRVHLGHREGTLNKYMLPFIYGSRLDHLIFDLDKTAELLQEALNFTAHVAFRGGIILLVNRTPQYQVMVENTAMECEVYAHTRPVRNGIFTDSTAMFGCAIRLPDLIIALNTLETTLQENIIIKESAKMRIPIVGIVDTNCDPRLITYPIPGNDDSHAAVSFYCKIFKQAILNGKAKQKEMGLQNVIM